MSDAAFVMILLGLLLLFGQGVVLLFLEKQLQQLSWRVRYLESLHRSGRSRPRPFESMPRYPRPSA